MIKDISYCSGLRCCSSLATKAQLYSFAQSIKVSIQYLNLLVFYMKQFLLGFIFLASFVYSTSLLAAEPLVPDELKPCPVSADIKLISSQGESLYEASKDGQHWVSQPGLPTTQKAAWLFGNAQSVTTDASGVHCYYPYRLKKGNDYINLMAVMTMAPDVVDEAKSS